jgi:amino acid adenylation domain-containing protein
VTLDTLLATLAASGIQLRADGDEVVVTGNAGALDAALVGELRARKAALRELVREHGGWWAPRRITPEMLPLVALSQAEIDGIVAGVEGGAGNVQDIYPLAPLQEGILFHHLLKPDGDPYLLPSLASFEDRERLDAYLAALQAVIDRHDILRTAVVWEGLSEPVQVVWRRARLAVEEVELEAEGDAAQALWERFGPRRTRLDVRRAPLVRACVAHDAAEGRWLLLLLKHHLISDHTTLEVMEEEIRAHLEGREAELSTPLPFRNFVAQARLGASPAEHEAFFRALLGDVDEPTAPFGLMDVWSDGTGIEVAGEWIQPALDARLRARARALGVSVASLCHVAWGQVLARVTGRDDVVFGTVLFGRMQGGEGADRAMGVFMNTLPVRVRVDSDGAEASVRGMHRQLAGLLRHEHASLALAQRCSGVEAPAPLFTSTLNYRHNPGARRTRPGEAREGAGGMRALRAADRTNYPVGLAVTDLGGELGLSAQAPASVGAARVCALMHRALEALVEALEAAPRRAIGTLDVLPEAERRRVVEEWNRTEAPYPDASCVHELFEAQAERTPGGLAVVWDDGSLTYAELNARANRLAHHLRGLGVVPGVRVGVCAERSPGMVAALLAVMKAGGAYVPLDPDYPRERLRYMLDDSRPAVLLTQGGLRERFDALEIPVVALDDGAPAWASRPDTTPPRAGLTPEHPAYVIYTSGSTGQPKGVVSRHRAVVNLLAWAQGVWRLGPDDAALHALSFSFDVSVREIFGPLIAGARLVLALPGAQRDPARLVETIRRHEVGALVVAASFVPVLLEEPGLERCTRLRRLVTGGEALAPDAVRELLRRLPGARLHHEYGPTETTIASTVQEYGPGAAGGTSIGRPVSNTRVYVLDRAGRPAPVGVGGELHIGGAGVAHGYLHRPALTAERFVPDPFSPRPGARLYCTGDLGRWRVDGTLEFLGRTDDQVKIRGFRVEPGEIEARLREHAAVREAVVVVRQDAAGDRRLVAYYAGDASLEVEALRRHAAERLPEHMVPAAFVRLETLPRTASGKIDRKALPAPEGEAYARRGYEAPAGEAERALAEIWAELLGVERVGRWDNFFELGGHSLLIVKLIARMRRQGLHTEVGTLFTTPVLAELAEVVSGETREVVVPANLIDVGTETITPAMLPLVALSQADVDRVVAGVEGGAGNVQDIYPLAPLQEGILFHHLLAREGDPYLASSLFGFERREQLDAYVAALQAIIDRHDILRTAVVWEGLPEPVQVVWRRARLAVQEVELRAGEEDAAQALWARLDPRRTRLDIRRAPLMRAAMAHDAAEGRWLLLVQDHHLIGDHTTMEVLREEIRAHQQGRQAELPAPQPFRNFVAQARLGVSRAEHEAYFRALLADVTEPTAPFGLMDVWSDGTGVDLARRRVEPELEARLRARARTLGVSAASLCHVAWARVLARVTGREDVVFGTVLFGRMQGGEGSDRAMGIFMNTLPVRARMDGEGAEASVRGMHRQLAQLLRHEHASLGLAQRCSGVEAPAPLFTSFLNYRHNTGRGQVRTLVAREASEGMRRLRVEDRSNYPLALSVNDADDGMELTAQAPGSVGAARVCALMHRALQALADALEVAPDRAVGALDVLPEAERRLVVEAWNATAADVPSGVCVHELFQAQAERAPGAAAVVFGDVTLSYAELNARANRLARHLRGLGVGPDARVAICVERSPEMVVVVLGVLKAGGAWVPLDPGYPAERLRYMLLDSAPRVVLTQSSIAANEGLFDGLDAQVLPLDAPAWSEQAATNPERGELRPDHLAYVIYTSGSTGRPKGVMVAHRNVANLVAAQARTLGVDSTSRVLQFASFSFDASVFEMVMALCQGASLHLPPGVDLLAGDALERVVREGRITHVTLPPAVLPTLPESADLASVETMVLAGEAVPAEAVQRWAGGRRLLNAYGPTEAAVWTTVHQCRVDESGDPPIGRPIANARVYVLDPAGEPAPVAVAGELYIGGAGVARGYLGRPALTAQRFVPDPFGGEPGARLYRTGDLARWRADGTLEFLGRTDFQVKLRGFRIELGEIEARLREHPSVREAVVIAREDDAADPRLVAYWVGEDAGVEALRLQLSGRLPEYMVPAAFVRLEALPLTPNGKLDRRALPSPEGDAFARRGDEAPVGETEQALAEIWCEVLGVDRVGRWDDFFELGGHSLLVVLVISRIQQVLGAEVEAGTIFERPVLKELAEALAGAGRAELPLIERVDRGARLPLSYAQQRLWFLEQMGDVGTAYHVPQRLRLHGALDREALIRALDGLVARHEVLRTTFPVASGEPEQRIGAETRFHLVEQDLSGQAPDALERVMDAEVAALFDLERGPLIRGRLVRLAEDDHVLLLTMHHIVADGWSMGVFVDELSRLYAAFREGRPDPLPPLPIQYADYASWQRRWVEDEVLERQASYWTTTLAGAPELLELPTDHPRPRRQDHAGAALRVELDAELTEGLRALARRNGTTLFMTVLAGWATVLARLSGQPEVVIGTPTANRGRPEIEGLIGFFINTLALRVDLAEGPTVARLLEQVKERTLRAQQNQDIPFEQVVERLDPARSLAHTPLFQVLFAWQNAPGGGGLELPGLRLGRVPGARQTTAKFDLTLSLGERDGRVSGTLDYATSLFGPATAERYVGYLRRVLEQMAADDARAVDGLELLPDDERRQVVEEWNRTAEHPRDACIHALFEAQVERTPGAAAVTFGDRTLTYADLNARANRLARHLRALGVGPDARVAVCVERGMEMVIAILAVLKAGGGYVPLDPAYPEDRLRHALQDSAPAAVLTQAPLAGLFAEAGVPVVDLAGGAAWDAHPASNPDPARVGVRPEHLAYVIYTSGSTGQPKGVMVEHRNVARLFSATDAWFGFGPDDVWTLFHSFAFDFSVWEIWGALLYGGRLVIVPRDTARSPDDFYALLCEEGVTVLNQTPSAFRQLIAAEASNGAEHRLRYVVFGGEALELATLRPWFERNDDRRTRLVNMYGITETTVHVTYRPVERADAERAGPSPIGVRIPDLTTYVLDPRGEPVPVGVTGELYVGGAGVARGYLNRPELTAERFVRDPFSAEPGARLYRTGDLARWLADGTLEYLGRNDAQVKIRGFRIEPGEIEARLQEHAAVRQAVVVVRGDAAGGAQLVAYLVGEGEVDPEALRQHLRERLPEHMVPAAYVRLEALPLTPSGKLDHGALPAPEAGAYARRGYEAPAGPVEAAVAEVWAELLGVERVGRHDNFFELGGHSLLAMTLIERMRLRGVPADVRTLFTAPTLAALAAAVGERQALPEVAPNGIPAGCTAITPEMLPLVELDPAHVDRIVATVQGGAANLQDVYPLLPLQEGILFHHLLAAEGDPYLLGNVFGFDTRGRLDAFLDGLRMVIGRHDILRTAVLWEGLPEPVQVVWRSAPLPVEEVELDPAAGDPARQLFARFDPRHTRLDIRQAPLLRAYVARGETPESWVLLLVQHHLIDDNTSLKRIFAEIRAHLSGRAEELPAPVPFRDFVAQARRGADRAEDEAFFRGLLGDVTEPTAPFGLLDARGDGRGIGEASLFVDLSLAERLRRSARTLGVGVATLCHVAYSLLLARASGRADVVFGTVLFGRMQGGDGADQAMGMFINTLPVRVRVGPEGAADAVRHAHGLLAELLRHEHASLALAQRCSGVPAPTPLFSALLNYRHAAAAASQPDDAPRALEGIRRLMGQERTNYPLAVAVDDLGQGFRLSAKVLAPVDAARVCAMMEAALQGLVDALERAPGTPLARIGVLPEAERRLVVDEWNGEEADYPRDACIHALFEAQVERTPGAVAAVFEGERLTYGELNARANRLAHHLCALGVGPDARVALCVERSLEMVVGVLGILKAGGAWVPLDPAYPAERLRYLLEDSGAALVLTRDSLRGRFAHAAVPVADVAAADDASLPASNPERADLTPAHLAYVIYTSGSTGLPKGVMVAHAGVVNLVHWMARRWPMDEGDALLQKTPLGFDVSVWELFWPLISGARLVVARPEGHRDPEYLAQVIRRERVTAVAFVPSMLQLFLDHPAAEGCTSLRWVMSGGEALPEALVRRLHERLPAAELYNRYAPTEATVNVLAWRCRAGETPVHLGRPRANVPIYILDPEGEPVPVGVTGELHIGGVQVARGYQGRPGLTAERFVPDPFASEPGARLYRTGDLARWRPDGAVELAGRDDFQVKLRGIRIEPGEIEARLREHPAVREAVVLAREDAPGDRRLVAYCVAGEPLDVDALRRHLGDRLPEHMVPAAYVRMDHLPLTPNGKLDRRALPAPEGEAFARRGYEAPLGETEEALAEIWSELLGVERVGRWDDFFELGGHSLLIVRLIERMRRRGLYAEVATPFTAPVLARLAEAVSGETRDVEVPANAIPAGARAITPEMLPLVSLSRAEIDRVVAGVEGGAENVQDIYPLAPVQEGILFHHLLRQDRDPYVVPTLYAFDGRDELDAYLGALQAVIQRHDTLRTAVAWEGLPEPVQVVWRRARLQVQEVELHAAEGEAATALWTRFDPRRTRMDVRRAPLMRAAVAHDAARGRWLLLVHKHHLISDHLAVEVLQEEIRAHLLGRQAELPAPLPFRNYVAQARLGAGRAGHEAFFRGLLAGVEEPTAPFGLLDVQGDGSDGEVARRRVEPALEARLRARARGLGVSAASVCHVAWGQVLARVTGRGDVVFGTVLFGRMQGGEGSDRVMGPFVNTLPVRVRVGAQGAEAGVRAMHGQLADLLRHEHASLALAQRCSAVEAPTPLFTSLLNYRHNAGAGKARSLRAESLGGMLPLRTETHTNYPVELSVDDWGEALGLMAHVPATVGAARVCALMHRALEALVDALEAAPERGLGMLDVLPEAERRMMVEEWNRTDAPYPADSVIHELFQAQVERTPDAVAVVFAEEALSYGELNRRANRLAHHLRGLGVRPDTRVGLCVERGLDMMVAILGALKAGGTYVPLDPAYPAERLRYMLADSRPAVMLTRASIVAAQAGLFEDAGVPVLDLDAPAWGDQPATDPERGGLTPDHLAYLIYTSGSTGQPKGAMLLHRGLVNMVHWQTGEFGITERDSVLIATSYSFDVTQRNLLGPLVRGGQVHLADEPFDPRRVLARVRERRTTVTNMTPTPFHALIDADAAGEGLGLRLVALGGEPFRPDKLAELPEPRPAFVNTFGPTECSGCMLFHRASPELSSYGDGPVPLGKPIANSRIYVLDGAGEPAPVGVVGELYIGGVQVGRGYHGRPGLTAERFVPDPFSGRPGARLYRTGDLGRWRPDGSIEFAGRNDFQVKVRGFRVELGEIEARLREHAAVHEAVVVAREGSAGDQRLVAYWVGDEAGAGAEALRRHVGERLPEYMVPAAYIHLERFPTTPSGKLDRRALPSPEGDAYARREYEAPAGELEEALAEIWSEVLGVERVGRQDQFFELGGHSLLVVRVVSRVRQLLGVELELGAVFEHPVLASLAERILDMQLIQFDPEELARLVSPLGELDPDASPVVQELV